MKAELDRARSRRTPVALSTAETSESRLCSTRRPRSPASPKVKRALACGEAQTALRLTERKGRSELKQESDSVRPMLERGHHTRRTGCAALAREAQAAADLAKRRVESDDADDAAPRDQDKARVALAQQVDAVRAGAAARSREAKRASPGFREAIDGCNIIYFLAASRPGRPRGSISAPRAAAEDPRRRPRHAPNAGGWSPFPKSIACSSCHRCESDVHLIRTGQIAATVEVRRYPGRS